MFPKKTHPALVKICFSLHLSMLTTSTSQVNDSCQWLVPHLPAIFPHGVEKINFFRIHEVIWIHSPDPLECLPPYQHTSAGHIIHTLWTQICLGRRAGIPRPIK